MGVRNENGLIGLQNIIKQIDNHVESQVIGFVQDLRQTLVDATPIETPPTNDVVAKEHWKIAVDSYTMAGSTDTPSYGGGVEIDTRVRNSGRFLKAPGKGGGLEHFNIRKSQNIVVYNDVPYMARLNRGWSTQAAAGFIERCVDQVQSRWGML